MNDADRVKVSMKLGGIELIKREDNKGKVIEIRSVSALSVIGTRNIVELPIPGSDGNAFQDMGRNPSVISFDGDLLGPEAVRTLADLKKLFDQNKPVTFSSDMALISEITSVMIEKFIVHFEGGVSLGFSYSMILKEHKSTSMKRKSVSGGTEPPSQKEGSKKDFEEKLNKIYDDSSKKALGG